MKFVTHPQHTRYLGAPLGWNEQRDGPCGALSIHDMRDQQPAKMESCWELEGFEPISLALNLADIRLGVIGSGHPPVYMQVMPKPGKSHEDVKAAMQGVLTKLAHYAEVNELVIRTDTQGRLEVAEKA
jgi:hypothetical protein